MGHSSCLKYSLSQECLRRIGLSFANGRGPKVSSSVLQRKTFIFSFLLLFFFSSSSHQMTGYTYDIPNLHPSRRGSICSSFDDTLSDNRSVKDHIESFVGSYSRTSMVHMAENVLVGDEMVPINL